MVELPTIAALAFAAFAAGFVDSIAGGGGLLTVPSLLVAGLPPHVAIATNKGQACFGATSAFVSFWSRGAIDRSRAKVGFACGVVGSLVGAGLLLVTRPEPLKPVVLVLLVSAMAFVAWPRSLALATGHARSWARAALGPVTFTLGVYDGFFGPGVGSMLIVSFVVMFGDSLTKASGNAKAVNLASNLAALSVFAWRGTVLWRVALPMAAANALGAFVGARLAMKRGDKLVRTMVFAVVSILVVKIAVDVLRR